jgi:cytochrome c-type biogenesis protein CcsB
MAQLEYILLWITIVLYALNSVTYLYSFVFKNEKIFDRAIYFVIPSFIVHTSAIIVRTVATGSLPVAGDFETAVGGAWIIVLFTLFLAIWRDEFKPAGVATLPFSMILLGYGQMRVPALVPLALSLKSVWLYVHVFFAQIAFGAFTVAFGMGIVYLLKEKHPEKPFYKRFPSLARLDDLIFKSIVFGFITDAVMIASGAIWAKDLWGNYWSWDPVEMWSLVTWIIYGLAIHLRVTMGWRGRKMAWIAIFAILGTIITFFGVNLVVETSTHIFDS